MVLKDGHLNKIESESEIETRTFVPTADKHNGAVVYQRYKMLKKGPPIKWLYKSGNGTWVLAEREHKPKTDLIRSDQEEKCPVNQSIQQAWLGVEHFTIVCATSVWGKSGLLY